MRLIFLDFDGVIVTRHTEYACGHAPCVQALNHIVDKTGAHVIVSSTWRHFGLVECIRYLEKWGFKGTVRAVTGRFRESRGEEIRDFLDEYDDIGIKVNSFVILDDDTDVGIFTPYLVRTDLECGLTMADAEKAIAILILEGRWP